VHRGKNCFTLWRFVTRVLTMSTSHRALFVGDILLEIFGYIDIGGTGTIAPVLVHPFWTELFSDKIWYKLSTMEPIFDILFGRFTAFDEVSMYCRRGTCLLIVVLEEDISTEAEYRTVRTA
jgi:hypothetical protein